MNKTLITIILIVLVVGGGAFYGGIKYAQSKTSQDFGQEGFQERQQRMGAAGSRTDSGFATGEIISKDEQSITIKLGQAGSKIIFYSENTEISKFVKGAIDDLEIGKSVTINGEINEDGSITAHSIQLRAEITPLQ